MTDWLFTILSIYYHSVLLESLKFQEGKRHMQLMIIYDILATESCPGNHFIQCLVRDIYSSVQQNIFFWHGQPTRLILQSWETYYQRKRSLHIQVIFSSIKTTTSKNQIIVCSGQQRKKWILNGIPRKQWHIGNKSIGILRKICLWVISLTLSPPSTFLWSVQQN